MHLSQTIAWIRSVKSLIMLKQKVESVTMETIVYKDYLQYIKNNRRRWDEVRCMPARFSLNYIISLLSNGKGIATIKSDF
jgi:hypothetical protein